MIRIPSVEGLSLRDAATAYARAGLYVVPLHMAHAKNPGHLIGKGWQHHTSNDPDTVAGWFDGVGIDHWYRKELSIDGIALHVGRSGLVVLDVDDREALPEWLAKVLKDSKPARQFTNDSKKKFHAVYDAEGEKYGNSRGSLEEGWGEVRGTNGVIVLQPSPHPKVAEGGCYRWDAHDVPGLPQVISAKLKAPRSSQPEPFDSVDESHGLGTPVPHGRRDEEMFRYASYLRTRNLDRTSALVLMRERAKDFENDDGRVNEAFLVSKLDSAWSYRPGTTEQQQDLSPEDEELFWKARPELSHLRDFARARRVAPWAVLGITLARVLLMVHHKYMIPPTVGSATSLNFFVAVCGPSGGGKSAARGVSKEAVRMVNEPDALPIGSGEGISASYMEILKAKKGEENEGKSHRYNQYRYAVLFEAEEIATLGAMFKRSSATLGETLRRGWDGKTLGYQYRAVETRLIVPEQNYRMCMWVGVQPDAAHILLDEAGLGTPQRFVWVTSTDVTRPAVLPTQPEPVHWTLPPFPDELDFVDNDSMPQVIDLCDTAVREIIDAADAKLQGAEGMDGHLLLCQVKVAAALGLLSGHWGVSEEDWALAGQVMSHSNAVRASLVSHIRRQAASKHEAQQKVEAAKAVAVRDAVEGRDAQRVAGKVLKALRASVTPLTRGDVSRAVSGRERQYLDEALDLLGPRIRCEEGRSASGQRVVLYTLEE